jgi:hypothetical protein
MGAAAQDPVRDLGTGGYHRARLVPEDQFSRRRAIVPGQTRDLLDGHAIRQHQGHKRVAQVPPCAAPGVANLPAVQHLHERITRADRRRQSLPMASASVILRVAGGPGTTILTSELSPSALMVTAQQPVTMRSVSPALGSARIYADLRVSTRMVGRSNRCSADESAPNRSFDPSAAHASWPTSG